MSRKEGRKREERAQQGERREGESDKEGPSAPRDHGLWQVPFEIWPIRDFNAFRRIEGSGSQD